MNTPTPERLKELFQYNPETGELRWKIDRGKCRSGQLINCRNEAGYILVRADNCLLRAHRVGWAVYFGKWPSHEIDHVNGIRDDNRITNLREASRLDNMKNIKKTRRNTSGFKGVSWSKNAKKWQAHIRAEGKSIRLGYFDKPEDAHAAYKKASDLFHGEFGRHD